MGFANSYLKKNQFIKLEYKRVPIPSGLLQYIVIIPSFSEPEIFATLESLKKCWRPKYHVEVFILINYSESIAAEIKQQNQKLFEVLENWTIQNRMEWLTFIPFIAPDLPEKHAGAGLARKILMDAAVERFSLIEQANGIIYSLDADTLVPENYFVEIEKHRENNPKTNCFIFNFQHPTDGKEFSKSVYKAATQYELHLRYYKQIVESTGFPYYLYTIGSCFAINALTYTKVGGMSKRKAGEDFYFLQKAFAFSNSAFLKNAILTPSSRPSWRVPFGTGPAIRNMLNTTNPTHYTYHPKLFEGITQLVNIVPKLYSNSSTEPKNLLGNLPRPIFSFLLENKISERIIEINNNSSSENAFVKRFFNWFDGFLLIKYLNYSSVNYIPNTEVVNAVKIFLQSEGMKNKPAGELLLILRERDMQT